MNYIVFDLEWNQGLDAKHNSDNKLPFEIIEIGAVKLDKDFKMVGMFSQIIKPQVHTVLHPIMKELLDITEEDLAKGTDFATAYSEFIAFCGDNYRFCTWGDSDIHELMVNAEYFGVPSSINNPIRYLDIQRLYSRYVVKSKNREKLITAIGQLGLKANSEFHRAINDAKYTAMVMQNIDMPDLKNEVSIDTYFVPKTKAEEIFVKGKDYTRFLSMAYDDRTLLLEDADVSSLKCPLCGRNCKRRFPWFLSGGKTNYFILGSCLIHGSVKGKLMTKSTADNKVFALKKISFATPEDEADIMEKKSMKTELQRKKRQRKKHGPKNS